LPRGAFGRIIRAVQLARARGPSAKEWEHSMTTVAHILAVKGQDVVTASQESTLSEIVRTLAERGIGAVVVTGPTRNVLGIVSERDIVRAIARGGREALNDKVARHMTVKVKFAHGITTVTEAMEHMTRGRFRHLPVVEDGALCGLVSIGDIVKHRLAEIESESQALRDYIATA
jgi:CBS domain-containing protein